MADTSGGAFIGYPKQRSSPRNEEAAARLAALLRGVTGEETPEGSVLDPNYQSASETNKLGRVLGLASDMPSPKSLVAGAAGMMFPYIKGAKGLAAFQTPEIEAAVTKAMELLRAGKTPTEVGQATGMWLTPRGGSRAKLGGFDPDNAGFMREIPDNDMKLRSLLLTPAKKPLPLGNLEDVLSAPTLFDHAPYLRKVQVGLDSKLPATAAVTLPKKSITLNPTKMKDLEEVKRSLSHEIEHVVQQSDNKLVPLNATMPAGGSLDTFDPIFSQNSLDIMGPKRLDAILEELRANPTNDAKRAIGFLETLRTSQQNPKYGYDRLFGVQQAEAVAKRLNYTPEQRLAVSPYEDYLVHPFRNYSGVNKQDLGPVRNILKDAKDEYDWNELGDTSRMAEQILARLRKPSNPK